MRILKNTIGIILITLLLCGVITNANNNLKMYERCYNACFPYVTMTYNKNLCVCSDNRILYKKDLK